MICFDLDMTLFFSFRYFCRLLLIVVLWLCSTSSFACIERQIKNVSLYEPSCEFSVNRKESTNNKAYVQFQYQKKNLMETMQVMQSLTSSLPYAISIHSYQNGFRSMIGPVDQKDIAKVKQALAKKGYRETLVKYLASSSDSDFHNPKLRLLLLNPDLKLIKLIKRLRSSMSVIGLVKLALMI